MLIAAAASGSDLDAIITDKYENCSHLLIVETDTEEIVGLLEKQDKDGFCFVETMAGMWVEAIVCGKIAPHIFPFIADAGISRYNGAGLSVREGLAGAVDNSLPLMIKE